MSGACAAAVVRVGGSLHRRDAQVVQLTDGIPGRDGVDAGARLGKLERSMNDIESKIIELVAKSKNLAAGSVGMESTFDELQIDSLDKINLSFAVEEMFGIEIPDENLNSLKTVGDVVRGVELLRAAQSPGAAQT